MNDWPTQDTGFDTEIVHDKGLSCFVCDSNNQFSEIDEHSNSILSPSVVYARWWNGNE